jgi:hypothetical protein
MPDPKPPRTVADTAEPGDRPDQVQPDVTDHKKLLPGPTARERETVARQATDRAGAVAETAAALTGAYERGELGRLREDWPV